MPQNLYKSRTNKVIAGVCGGLAEYFQVDATIIRLAWAITFFMGGAGLFIYILAMIIIPEGPAEQVQNKPMASVEGQALSEEGTASPPSFKEDGQPNNKIGEKRNQILGLALVAIGVYFVLHRFFPVLDFDNWWPVLLVLLGIFILIKGKGGSR